MDTNLLLLLVVGTVDRKLVDVHKNLSGFTVADFDLLGQAISLYSDIVLLPHVLAELSSLARQIKGPARSRIQAKIRELVHGAGEVMIPTLSGVARDDFPQFGLTDAVILHLCTLARGEVRFSLLTADRPLAVQAEMLGYDVQDFNHLRAA